MAHLLSSIDDHGSAPPPTLEEANAATAELNRLLLQQIKVGNEIARIRKLLKRLAYNANSHRPEVRSSVEMSPPEASNSPDHRRRRSTMRTRGRTSANASSIRSMRSKLERACRIALMESNEPASIETIYHRIQKRGSYTFVSYRHPFRAIELAMGAIMERGEASLLDETGRRAWCWKA